MALVLLAEIEWQKNPAKAREHILQVVNNYSHSAFLERAKAMLPSLELILASRQNDAGESYLRAFFRIPGKEWQEYENEILAAAKALSKNPDRQIYLGFLAEALLNLPSDFSKKKELLSSLNPEEQKLIYKWPKLRDPSYQVGVKSISPDSDLFDAGIDEAKRGNWKNAEEKFSLLIKTYPESDHLDRARYWKILSKWELGDKSEAQEAFAAFYKEQPLTYYGMLAAQKANLSIGDAIQSAAPTVPSIEPLDGILSPRQRRSLLRAKALLDAGALELARKDLENLFQQKPVGATLGTESPRTTLSLANFYYEGNYYLGSFSQARIAFQLDRSLLIKENLKYIFPELPFAEDIRTAANEAGIHPFLLRSLIKQESAFLPDAVSRSNAFGLTQIIFPTAREIKSDAVRNQLFQPELSTKWGAIYVRRQIDRFQGNAALALAAYNAGPSRAQQWQKKWLESPVNQRMDFLVEFIPFTETRKYVSSILRNFAWYKLMAGEKMPATLEELVSQWPSPQATPPKN